eukprot:GHVU01091380.1.p1 GENE.GHVU01091380.1~~GHVU01091380.1.p1  ORF type:complete len:262 (-),score=22.21 GHVU01091380.1:12-797(-)
MLNNSKKQTTVTQQEKIRRCLQQYMHSDRQQPCLVFWALQVLQLIDEDDASYSLTTSAIEALLNTLATAQYDIEDGYFKQPLPFPSAVTRSSSLLMKCLSKVAYTQEQHCMLSRWANQNLQLLQNMVQWGNQNGIKASEDLLQHVSSHTCDACDNKTATEILQYCQEKGSSDGWLKSFVSVLDDLKAEGATDESTRYLQSLSSVCTSMDLYTRRKLANKIIAENRLQSILEKLNTANQEANKQNTQHITKSMWDIVTRRLR